MSTIQTDVFDILSTFEPEARKYDLRTAEGKKWKEFTSLTEYEVITGKITIHEERYNASAEIVTIPVVYPAIRIVRTVEIDEAVISQYLQLSGIDSKFIVVNEAVWREAYSTGHWVHVDVTVWTLEESGINKVNKVIKYHEQQACKAIALGLKDKWKELEADIDRINRKAQEKREREQRVEDAKASFVPSNSYLFALENAQRFINGGVKPSNGDNDTWHNHVHVAIDTEVLNLCKHFVEILGKTNQDVRTAFTTYLHCDAVVVIDEYIAYATVVAERTGRSWSSNDYSATLIGEALHRFTRIVRSY